MMNHKQLTARKIDARKVLLVIIAGLAVFTFFSLFTGFGASYFNWLPFLLLLACPFMHFLMHGRHAAYDAEGGGKEKP